MPAFYSLWTITTVHTFIFHPIQSSSSSQLLSDLEPVMGKMERVAHSAHSFATLFLSYLPPPLPAPTPQTPSGLEQGQGSEKTGRIRGHHCQYPLQFSPEQHMPSVMHTSRFWLAFSQETLSQFFRVLHDNRLTPPIPDKGDAVLVSHKATQLPSSVHRRGPLAPSRRDLSG